MRQAKSPENSRRIVAKKSRQSLTHFDVTGAAHMVDVSDKNETHRVAIATGEVKMRPATLRLIVAGKAKKGDVLGIARVAAILGAKRACDLIPLAHPIGLTRVATEFKIDRSRSRIHLKVTAETLGRTGVEMEALAGVAAGLLTIYDMCKAVDRAMLITQIHLVEKSGGQSGHFKWSQRKVS